MKQYKNIRICILNYDKFYKEIQNQQCIQGAYSKEELIDKALKEVKKSIDYFGYDVMCNNTFESVQLPIAKNMDKVYWLAIARGIPRYFGTSFMVYLYYKGFLE